MCIRDRTYTASVTRGITNSRDVRHNEARLSASATSTASKRARSVDELVSRRRASPPRQAIKLRRERRADIKQQICAQQQHHPDHLCWEWGGGLAEMTRGPNRFNLTVDECIDAYIDTNAAPSAVQHRTTLAVSIKYAENCTVTRNHAVKRTS